jgi:PKD domain
MNNSASSRLRRNVAYALVGVLGAGFLTVSAVSATTGKGAVAAQAPSSATRLSGFTTTRGSVRVGGELSDGVTVLPRTARAVTVQYRRAGTRAFTNASTDTTSSRGVTSVGLRPPAAGSWQFRVVVAATMQATRFVSPTRSVVASGRAVRTRIIGFATTSATVSLGGAVTDDVSFSPSASRVVAVQARRPGSQTFVPQSTGTSSRAGRFQAVYRPTSAGVWQYRLVVQASATALPITSPTRQVTATGTTPTPTPTATRTPTPTPRPTPTVTPTPTPTPTGTQTPGDSNAPGRITNLRATFRPTSINLFWTNPTDADFTGVVIRRAIGDTAPSTVTDGTAVAVTDWPTPGNSFTDTCLIPDTHYAYALFAHDGARNYAAAATLTATTNATGPTAGVLSVNNLGFADNKLTVNELATFEASCSFAPDTTNLELGTLDYGGNSPTEPLTGPAGSWNTSHSYTTTGQKTVTLTVTDAAGTTDSRTTTVTVFAAPTGASISETSGAPRVGVPVRFALAASTPPGTVLNSYTLLFGPAAGDRPGTPTEETFTVTHNTTLPATVDVTFSIPGSYRVQFRVENDAGGATDAQTVILVVGR